MANNNRHIKSEDSAANALPWMAGVLFVLGMAILAGMYWNRTVVVNEVRYEGNYFVPSETLEKRADITHGIPPDSLRILEIIERVERLAYVKRAHVNVEPSGNLIVEVEERQPIAMIAEGEKKIYVDEAGIRLPIILGKAVDVPVVYGFDAQSPTDTLRSEPWQKVRNFLIEMHSNPVCDATISEVAWTGQEGIVALSHENGVRLVFGKNDFKTRLRNWEAFYSEVVREKGIHKMQSVDLRFRGQVVTRES